jgi:hypothetical protein
MIHHASDAEIAFIATIIAMGFILIGGVAGVIIFETKRRIRSGL